MSVDEQILIVLERRGDRWAATYGAERVTGLGTAAGSAPGEVLESIGQHLDDREARRLDRLHGLQDVLDYATAGLPPDGPAYRQTDAGVELVLDDERVLEVLGDRRGEWLDVKAIAAAAGFNVPRAVLALERLLAQAGVDVDRDGDRWRIMGEGDR